jgi:hypothetical protein
MGTFTGRFYGDPNVSSVSVLLALSLKKKVSKKGVQHTPGQEGYSSQELQQSS